MFLGPEKNWSPNSMALLIFSTESQIKQLQYQLDKIKNDQNEGEQFASDKLNQVENKNES